MPRFYFLYMPGPFRLDCTPSQLALLIVCGQPQQKSGRKQPETQTQTSSLMGMLRFREDVKEEGASLPSWLVFDLNAFFCMHPVGSIYTYIHILIIFLAMLSMRC